MHVCLYVCKRVRSVCMHVVYVCNVVQCMCVCDACTDVMFVYMDGWVQCNVHVYNLCMSACNACIGVCVCCMYVCMHVCMYVYVYVCM